MHFLTWFTYQIILISYYLLLRSVQTTLCLITHWDIRDCIVNCILGWLIVIRPIIVFCDSWESSAMSCHQYWNQISVNTKIWWISHMYIQIFLNVSHGYNLNCRDQSLKLWSTSDPLFSYQCTCCQSNRYVNKACSSATTAFNVCQLFGSILIHMARCWHNFVNVRSASCDMKYYCVDTDIIAYLLVWYNLPATECVLAPWLGITLMALTAHCFYANVCPGPSLLNAIFRHLPN